MRTKQLLGSVADQVPIDVLKARGYMVRHQSEGRRLSWHRAEPLPTGLDFQTEALDKLREQVTPQMLEFISLPAHGAMPAVHSAILRTF